MTETPNTGAVLVEYPIPHVAVIRLNREQAGNAVNGEVAQSLDRAVKATEADPGIWVTVLTGTGTKAFCAGADLKEIAAGRADQLVTKDGGFAGFVFQKRTKPCIAAVDAPALAGGCELALACDLIVASEAARFALPEVKRGLVAAAGGLYRLPRALPRALAIELIITGDPIDAATAHAHGLVNRLVAPGTALAKALELAAAICVNAPLAVRESLAIARDAYELDEDALKKASFDAWNRVLASEDSKEGPRAFIEKRAPRWQGR